MYVGLDIVTMPFPFHLDMHLGLHELLLCGCMFVTHTSVSVVFLNHGAVHLLVLVVIIIITRPVFDCNVEREIERRMFFGRLL